MRRILAVLVALAVTAATVLLAAPTQAATVSWRATITFAKNQHSPSDSKVNWRLYQRTGSSAWTLVQTHSWRAGSGMLGKAGRNSCVKNTGWLPNGTYRIRGYADYHGHVIHGRAFRLDDKRCSNGTLRDDLFLHTETGPGNHQCADRPGDQPCRWEFPKINDYKSYGCIKLSPHDIGELMALYTKHFRLGVRYGTDRVQLRVVG